MENCLVRKLKAKVNAEGLEVLKISDELIFTAFGSGVSVQSFNQIDVFREGSSEPLPLNYNQSSGVYYTYKDETSEVPYLVKPLSKVKAVVADNSKITQSELKHLFNRAYNSLTGVSITNDSTFDVKDYIAMAVNLTNLRINYVSIGSLEYVVESWYSKGKNTECTLYCALCPCSFNGKLYNTEIKVSFSDDLCTVKSNGLTIGTYDGNVWSYQTV